MAIYEFTAYLYIDSNVPADCYYRGVKDFSAVSQSKVELAANLNAELVLSLVKDSVISLLQISSRVIAITTGGFYCYDKDTLVISSYATLANVTCICVTTLGLHLGTSNAGVYFLTEAELLSAGDKTGLLTQKYTTSSSPSIQSNSIVCIAGSAGKLLIGSTSGLDYIPNETQTQKYTLTSANVTSCCLNSSYIAYIVNGINYSEALPSANFTIDIGNRSAIQPVIADNITQLPQPAPSGGVWRSPRLAGVSGAATHIINLDQVTIQVFKIETDYSLTSTQVLATTSALKREVCGEYVIQSYYSSYTGCKIYRLSGNTVTLVHSLLANLAQGSAVDSQELVINRAGTFICIPIQVTAMAGSEFNRVHQKFTRSGDTLTYVGTQWILRGMVKVDWTWDDNYCVAAESEQTPGYYRVLNSSYATLSSSRASKYILSTEGKFLDNTNLGIIEAEAVSGGMYKKHLVLYTLSGSTLTLRNSIELGYTNNLLADPAEYKDYTIDVINGYFIVYDYTNYDAGVYARPATSRVFKVNGTTLEEIQGELSFTYVNAPKTVYTPAPSVNGRHLILLNDWDNDLGVSNITPQLFEDNAAVTTAYGTANLVKAGTDIFIGTDVGIFIEKLPARTTRKLGYELGSNRDVAALEPSATATTLTGHVIYGVDDNLGNAKVGVIDLDGVGSSLDYIPEDIVLTNVNDVWLNGAQNFGYDHTGFIKPAEGGILPSTVTWKIKETGVFNSHPVFAKVGSKFLPTIQSIGVVFFLNSAQATQGTEFTMDVLGEVMSYIVSAAEEVDEVITYFHDRLILLGFSVITDLTNDSIYIGGLGSLFITMPAIQILDYIVLPMYHKFTSTVALSNWSSDWSFTTG